MIPAEEALNLPSAQLTEDERSSIGKVLAEIEAHVRNYMQRRGVDITVAETNANVISEVNRRLRAAGYSTEWQAMVQPHPLNKALATHVGFKLAMAPSENAYKRHDGEQ